MRQRKHLSKRGEQTVWLQIVRVDGAVSASIWIHCRVRVGEGLSSLILKKRREDACLIREKESSLGCMHAHIVRHVGHESCIGKKKISGRARERMDARTHARTHARTREMYFFCPEKDG